MIRLQERRIERNKRFFKNQRVSVVRKGEPFRGPLRPRPVTKAFSRRANHQFTLVVLIVSVLAFIGGSFFPIGNLSNFFRILGNYTPNGAAKTAFLELLKGNEGLDI